mgnify:CR=1 FL=1
MINKNDLRKAISSIAISNAKRNTIYRAFSDLDSITKEEFDSVKSDISKVVESMLTKDTVGKANGVASLDSDGNIPIEQLGNIDTTLFLIVRELPTTDIETSKIYLVPNQDGQGNNVYIEYLYVEDVWEKVGEFKPEVDLSHIEEKLDTKADLDKSGYVEIEQLTPAVIYDKETNSINGVFELESLSMLNIVKNDNPANGYQYYEFDDNLDDNVVPQYIYDATVNEHIEITATTYLDDINDGNGGDAFNTVKPLDLTHDLYLDNEQKGVIRTIRRLKVDKLVSDSILINEGIYDVTNEITNNIVISTARQLISGDVNFNHNIILNASNIGKITNAKNGILISTDDNTNIISDSIMIGSNNNKLSTGTSCILIGNIKSHSKSNEINIGQKNTSASDGIIVGNNSQVGNKSVCIGNTNHTNKASFVTCIGNSINVDDTYDYAIVIGHRASAINSNKYDERYRLNGAIAIGLDAKVENAADIAIGFGANSKAYRCIAIGLKAVANADYSVAINSSNTNQVAGGVYIGAFTKNNKIAAQFVIGGFKDINTYYNIEETLTYNNQHKKYIYGIGGYDGTNTAAEGIKSLQEVLADKADASAIPTKVSQLTNDANFITSYIETDPVWTSEKGNYYTKTEIDNKGYLTAHQSLDAYAKKTEIPNVSTKADLVGGKLKTEQLPKLVNITTASTAEEVVTKFNALLADLKAKGYMEADTAE